MRRFEMGGEKFWQVEITGSEALIQWGKIGGTGKQQSHKKFGSDALAKTEVDKLIKKKIGEGFAEVGAAAPAPVAAPAAAPKPEPAAAAPAPPPRTAPSSLPERVVMDDDMRASAASERGKVDLPLDAGKDAWLKAIADHFNKPVEGTNRKGAYKGLYKDKFVRGLTAAGVTGTCRDWAQRLLDTYAASKEPKDLDVQADAAVFHDVPDVQLACYLLSRGGLAYLAKVMVALTKISLGHDWNNDSVYFEENPSLEHISGEVQRLAAIIHDRMPGAPDADEARKVIEAARADTRLDVRIACARALGNADWARADVEEYLKGGKASYAFPRNAFQVLRDPQTVTRLARKNPNDVPQALLLADMGLEATDAVIAAHDKDPGYAHPTNALAAIESLAAAKQMAHSLPKKQTADIAREYFMRRPDLALAALEPLVKHDAKLAPFVRPILTALGGGPSQPKTDAASADALPPVLSNPPWLSKKKPAKEPTALHLETLDREMRLSWTEEEQKDWAGYSRPDKKQEQAGHLKHIEKTLAEQPLHPGRVGHPNIDSSWNTIRWDDEHLLEAWNKFPREIWRSTTATNLIGRLGEKILPAFIDYAVMLRQPTTTQVLLYVVAPRVAPLMADGFASARSKPYAEQWLKANPEVAAVGLIPVAVGDAKNKDRAIAALRFLVDKGHGAVVDKVAAEYGKAAAEALRVALDFDAAEIVPAKIPPLPEWFKPENLPQVLLRDKAHALPTDAVRHLGTMLSFSSIEEPYVGIARVKAACDPASLEEFAWGLFETWLSVGAPSKEKWAFLALGLLGGDNAARRLTPLVRAWPGESQHARAVLGLDVLGAIGTDVALMNLNGIAQKLKFKGLQEKAKEKVSEIAEARGLTVDELADRLVPDLGLDDSGSLILDFGARTFTVSFDEELKPFVLDSSGTRLGDLPKPKQTDDAEKAKESTERWKTLKKDARTIASTQITRLEMVMCSQRKWKAKDFQAFVVDHPLVVHLARRLVWGSGKSTFRVAEDRSLVSADDKTVTLPDDAEVGLLHRLDMDDKTLAAWGDHFGRYELLQPFDQLGRALFSIDDKEKKSESLERIKGMKVKTGKVLGLEARGWRKGPPQDAGWVWEMNKTVTGGFELTLPLGGGICMGWHEGTPPEQELGAVGIAGTKGKASFGMLPPVVFSELVRELQMLKDE